MRKSKVIRLVLVASVMASCSSHDDYTYESRLHIRGDSTSLYTHSQGYYGGGGFYHFIPFGFYSFGRGYYHGGYESPAFSSRASVSRGGFGSSGIRVGG